VKKSWLILTVLSTLVALLGCGGKGAVGANGGGQNPSPQEWTWVSGSDVTNQLGTYGTRGTAAMSNVPGGRGGTADWTDASGNLWLFGGYGLASGSTGFLNDLWKYSSGEWTWVGGSNVANGTGSYGTQGRASSGNIPGARNVPMSWTDSAGNFWLFAGFGVDSAGTTGQLNDLWKYSGGEWTWMGGSKLVYQAGTYGTLGMAAPANIPGPRNGSMTWTDAAGNLWLFGGANCTTNGECEYLSDLWKFNGSEWTWMGGFNLSDQYGTYGTQGAAAPSNGPGARFFGLSWTDANGNFWLFGGYGFAENSIGDLTDLWEFSEGEWKWMGGPNAAGQSGTYGTQGTAAPGNNPGPRYGAVSWTDAEGSFWLFGGSGMVDGNSGSLNDLWKYSGGEWTWMGGPEAVNQNGVYGTQGTAAAGNTPGARNFGIGLTDANGNLWLFGGNDNQGNYLNDLWTY